MPRLELDLAPITAARVETEAAARALRAADEDVTVARTALSIAQREGAGKAELQRLARKVDEASARRTRARNKLRDQQHAVSGIGDGLLAQQDHARLVESLDGRVPLVLLPIRIETRFMPSFPDVPDRLCIRVYPDDLHILEHVTALTADEKRGGAEYWTAKYARKDFQRVLRDMATVFGSERAAYIVRVMTPTNAPPAEGATAKPRFPKVETIDARAKVSRAVLLPDRWCAIGYGPGRRELFRVWGNRIPDELPLSPDWLDTEKDAAAREDERGWLVNFEKALEVGMALKITPTDLGDTPIADLQIERLLVVGVDWTKDAAASATELANVLGAHRDAEGLSFLGVGTATNNTGASPAGHGSASRHAAPTLAAPDPDHRDALQLLNWALGLNGNALTAEGIGNAHLAEQRTAMHMLNVLWRGTFGEYLLEQWAPVFDEEKSGTAPLYDARSYALAYLRPTGALPLLRIGRQPYGILPAVGKAFRSNASPVEALIGKLLGVLRPMWEVALQKVPTLNEGAVEKAQKVLQTAPWSQVAYYRDREPNPVCRKPNPFADADLSIRDTLLKSLQQAAGIGYPVHLTYCNDFKPDPAYRAEILAGVPWVLGDAQDPRQEAAATLELPTTHNGMNYLARIGEVAVHSREQAAPYLLDRQGGPSLLEALAAFSVQKEQGDSVTLMAFESGTVLKEAVTLGTTRMPHVEALADTTTSFTVQTPKDLARVVLVAENAAAVSLGDRVAATLDVPYALQSAQPQLAAVGLDDAVAGIAAPARNLAAVKLSLEYLSTCTVGELNIALRSTLDCFSYRLDAWFSARANRRLEQLRTRVPQGLYTGGFAWVENLKWEQRPDSDGHLLAPSIGQAATAALLRSGHSSNLESGAFDIRLDSYRTSRAAALLQGLARDQPLAALYGYRIERGLRDAGLGRLIWPLRRAFPWRPAGERTQDESVEEIGARDVVDGAGLLDLWGDEGAGEGKVRDQLAKALVGISQGEHAAAELGTNEWTKVQGILKDVADLADSVADLLMAEGAHQIVHGNLERAAAAMAVADKQNLPPELEFPTTPRGGAGYTQRLVTLCPAPEQDSPWPEDDRAEAEPGVNAWLARMLGDPKAYRFESTVTRTGQPEKKTFFTLHDLSISPLSAVLLATAPMKGNTLGTDATGFRELLVRVTLERLDIPLAELDSDSGSELKIGNAPGGKRGLGEFEALASLLRAVLDHARPATRRDLVSLRDEIEAAEKKDPMEYDAEFMGVDMENLKLRLHKLLKKLKAVTAAVRNAQTLASLEKQLMAAETYLPRSNWPAQVLEAQADTFENDRARKAAFVAARTAVEQVLSAKAEEAGADPEKIDGQEPNRGQWIRRYIEAIRQLLGKDFPVVPQFTLGLYASEYSASLAQQEELSAGEPWAVHHWLEQLACVRDGVGHLSSLLAARDAVHGTGKAKDFAIVQFPHVPEQIWAARPEAWMNPPADAKDGKDPPEELEAYLQQADRKTQRDIHRAVPDLAIALHAFGGPAAVSKKDLLAGLVCDDWPEFVPDRYQTAAIGFHYDAPGARPPQSILLAMPPDLDQDAWTFEDVLDVINETFDLAKLRAVRPCDLVGALGAVLPASYLPQSYTDDEPGVGILKLRERALVRLQGAEIATEAFPLGKV